MAAVGLVVGAVGVKSLMRNPPVEADFLTKADFKAHEEKDAKEFAAMRHAQTEGERRIVDKLGDLQSHLEANSERRSIALHERMNEVVKSVAAQGATLNAVSRNQGHS